MAKRRKKIRYCVGCGVSNRQVAGTLRWGRPCCFSCRRLCDRVWDNAKGELYRIEQAARDEGIAPVEGIL